MKKRKIEPFARVFDLQPFQEDLVWRYYEAFRDFCYGSSRIREINDFLLESWPRPTSARGCAEAVGYRNWGGWNLQYGRFAKEVVMSVGRDLVMEYYELAIPKQRAMPKSVTASMLWNNPFLNDDEIGFFVSGVVGTDKHATTENGGEWHFRLRLETFLALAQLKWDQLRLAAKSDSGGQEKNELDAWIEKFEMLATNTKEGAGPFPGSYRA